MVKNKSLKPGEVQRDVVKVLCCFKAPFTQNTRFLTVSHDLKE